MSTPVAPAPRCITGQRGAEDARRGVTRDGVAGLHNCRRSWCRDASTAIPQTCAPESSTLGSGVGATRYATEHAGERGDPCACAWPGFAFEGASLPAADSLARRQGPRAASFKRLARATMEYSRPAVTPLDLPASCKNMCGLHQPPCRRLGCMPLSEPPNSSQARRRVVFLVEEVVPVRDRILQLLKAFHRQMLGRSKIGEPKKKSHGQTVTQTGLLLPFLSLFLLFQCMQ